MTTFGRYELRQAKAPCCAHSVAKASTEQPFMEIVKCGKCQRKLAEADYLIIAIKCPRCKTLNILKAERFKSEHHECHCKRDTREDIPEGQYHPA
ncbi:Com family DNA-binding transcriptional regulator [Methylomonas sp. EFPC1]|nr:Com family DNA-binding transcriptional regulator [Methylomonas sp. EFPC1]